MASGPEGSLPRVLQEHEQKVAYNNVFWTRKWYYLGQLELWKVKVHLDYLSYLICWLGHVNKITCFSSFCLQKFGEGGGY